MAQAGNQKTVGETVLWNSSKWDTKQINQRQEHQTMLMYTELRKGYIQEGNWYLLPGKSFSILHQTLLVYRMHKVL